MAKALQYLLLGVLLTASSLSQAQTHKVVREQGQKTSDTLCVSNFPKKVKLDSLVGNIPYKRYAYLVANKDDEVIKTIRKGDRLILKDSPINRYRVWGIAFEGTLNANYGDKVTQVNASIKDSLSSKPLILFKIETNGGKISSPEAIGGEVQSCLSSRKTIRFEPLRYEPLKAKYQFIITDKANDTISAIPDTNNFALGQLGPGEFNLLGIAYLGQLENLKVGNALSSLRASVCMDYSNNSISVSQADIKAEKLGFSNHQYDTLPICNGVSKGPIQLETQNKTRGKAQTAYIVTGTNNDTIRQTPVNEYVNFDSNGIGKWHVQSISYKGILINNFPGKTLNDLSATECMTLSKNQLLVKKDSAHLDSIEVDGKKDSVVIPAESDTTLQFEPQSKATPGAITAYLFIDNEQDSVIGYTTRDLLKAKHFPSQQFYVQAISFIGNKAKLQSITHSDSLPYTCYERSANRIKIVQKKGDSQGPDLEEPSNTLKAYPNPANDHVTVFIPKNVSENGSLQIIDPKGRVVLRRTIVEGQRETQLDVKGFVGKYFIRLQYPEKTFGTPLVVK